MRSSGPRWSEAVIRDAGAVPSFLGYHGFTGSICSSVNDRVVHGIPNADDLLAEGDLVSIDCGAILDGWHGDSAWTFGVGELSPADADLSDATRLSMEAGIAAMLPERRLTDISHAIELGTRAAEKLHGRSYGIVDGYGGHAIGREMHMDPFLPNVVTADGSRAAHWEHTVAVTEDGPRILTLRPE